MRISASLSSKGQVTIPQSVRYFLHIDTGDKVEFLIDHDNECVHMYGPQRPSACLSCEGTGTLTQSKKECFLCLGTGMIPLDFKPMLRIALWRERYGLDITPTLLVDEIFTGGLYMPRIEITHATYAQEDLRRVNDSLLIYLFLQFVAHDRNRLEPMGFSYLKNLFKGSPLEPKLNDIFRVACDSDE